MPKESQRRENGDHDPRQRRGDGDDSQTLFLGRVKLSAEFVELRFHPVVAVYKEFVSSCLGEHFLFRGGLDPRRWRELFDLGDFGPWQTGKQIFQIIKWVEAVPPTTAPHCVNHCAAFSGFWMANEQKVLLFMESFP
jgi:hypothetical protein